MLLLLMSAQFYTIVHFVGMAMLLLSIGAMISFSSSNSNKKAHLMLMHGVALLLIAVSGFGLIAKLNVAISIWLIMKILIWVIFGMLASLVFKIKQRLFLYFAIPLLVGLAAYFASMLQNIIPH